LRAWFVYERLAPPDQPEPGVPVLPGRRRRGEPAGPLERGAPDHGARSGDRVALVQQRPKRVRLELARRKLLPALASRPPVGPDHHGAPEADSGARMTRERLELSRELPGAPRVVGVGQSDKIGRERLEPRVASRSRPAAALAAHEPAAIGM